MVGNPHLKKAAKAPPKKAITFEIFVQAQKVPADGKVGETVKQYWWRMVAKNGQVIGNSAEGYRSKAHCRKMIGNIVVHLRDFDVGTADFTS